MRPSNPVPGDSHTNHTYSREGGYQASGEYKPEDNQYPKATPYGEARDADHEAQLKADHEAKAE